MPAANLRPAPFAVRHEQVRKGCTGVLRVDETGIRFRGAQKHAWS
jgi:hypothetical protein